MKRIICIIFLLTILKADCVPVMIPKSPCPMNFHYEYDGFKMSGVVMIYPQIYNRFRTDRLTLNVTIGTRYLPNIQSLKLPRLRKSSKETLKDITESKPISYRIDFPFSNNIPVLLKIQLNGVEVCRNFGNLQNIISEINLGHNLPLIDLDEQQPDDYDDIPFTFNGNSPEPAILDEIIVIPKVIQRIDEDTSQNSQQNQQGNNRLHATNSQCGTYDEASKYTQLISGGDKISPGTWPWLVAIYRRDSKPSKLVFQCSGSLISNRLVLTAAHCFKSNTMLQSIAARKIVLAFGRHDTLNWEEENMVISQVSEIIIHPDYLSKKDSTIFDADIAILKTKYFISYTAMIKPICLWPMSVDKNIRLVGSNGTLVGWGQASENTEKNIPRRLTLPVVPNKMCFPSERGSNAWRVFCAGTKKRGYAPCNGDSGKIRTFNLIHYIFSYIYIRFIFR